MCFYFVLFLFSGASKLCFVSIFSFETKENAHLSGWSFFFLIEMLSQHLQPVGQSHLQGRLVRFIKSVY